MHFVLLNGPIGSGKTYFAKELKSALEATGLKVLMRHFKTPIIEAVENIYEYNYGKKWEGSYEDLRAFKFHDGESGRDKMIQIGQDWNVNTPHLLSIELIETVNITEKYYVIVDDCGREQEYKNLSKTVPKTTLIYLENTHKGSDVRQTYRIYEHGQIFENDNRVCLKDYSIWTPDPEVDFVLSYIVNTGT